MAETTRHGRGRAGRGQAMKTLQGCFRNREPSPLSQQETLSKGEARSELSFKTGEATGGMKAGQGNDHCSGPGNRGGRPSRGQGEGGGKESAPPVAGGTQGGADHRTGSLSLSHHRPPAVPRPHTKEEKGKKEKAKTS